MKAGGTCLSFLLTNHFCLGVGLCLALAFGTPPTMVASTATCARTHIYVYVYVDVGVSQLMSGCYCYHAYYTHTYTRHTHRATTHTSTYIYQYTVHASTHTEQLHTLLLTGMVCVFTNAIPIASSASGRTGKVPSLPWWQCSVWEVPSDSRTYHVCLSC